MISPRSRLLHAIAVAVLSAASCLAAPGCANRPRAGLGAAPGAPTPTLAQSLETFLMARAGDDLQILALSGGGQNGAFGAGVLAGWRSAGRPRFDVVTGISTGAVQATFAFLGTPADDETMRRVYSTMTSADVLCMRPALAIPISTSAADFRPLERTLAQILDDATIDRVAKESEGGKRLLLVATVNLDSGRLKAWDMGAIARARAYDRYRAILRAATGPPVLADPVLLDGDIHADANVIGGVFIPNPETHLGEAKLAEFRAEGERRSPGLGTRIHLNVVMNALMRDPADRVQAGIFSLADRAVKILVTNASNGSLWYLYALGQSRGASFRYVAIPKSSENDAKDAFAFDRAKMQALYDVGVEAGRRPDSWPKEPPPVAEDGG